MNTWMTAIGRFKSPWFPTALVGVLGAVMCLTVSLNTLVNLTGASLVADYALIALAALFARPTGATAHGRTLITIAIGLVYRAILILPQRGKAWDLLHAAADEDQSG